MNRATDEGGGSTSGGATSGGSTSGDTGSGGAGSKRGVYLILAGLLVTGLVAGYSWLRGLPK